MSNDELIYWNAKGRAETARILYFLAGREYKDRRMEFTSPEWPKLKEGGYAPYRRVPLLVRDGLVIPQSMAFTRLIANETGRAGKDALERCLVDATVDELEELGNQIMEIYVFEKDPAVKEKRGKEFLQVKLPEKLACLEKQLAQNPTKSGYLVGDRLLWCDVHFHTIISRVGSAVLNPFPNCKALYAKVEAEPRIALWLKQRPATDL